MNFKSDGYTRVLLAVVRGARTHDEIMAATGRSRQVVNRHLHRLRDDGLVGFEDDKQGTIHPLLREVPNAPRSVPS